MKLVEQGNMHCHTATHRCVYIHPSCLCRFFVSRWKCLKMVVEMVHKAMGDEGFATGTDSLWLKLHKRE